ncbi:MAG: hypothetical protein KQH63_01260 [Desulfobulbaceae bacterium]|nr:hypothetical protein [Desulfobulbaceae bacterium]
MFASIRSKIALLVIVSVVILTLLGMTSAYIDKSKSGKNAIASLSRELAVNVAESMMLEEQYIKLNHTEILKKIEDTRGKMAQVLASLGSTADAGQEKGIIERILSKDKARRDVFQQIKTVLPQIREEIAAYNDVLEKLNDNMTGIVGAISEEESFLSMEGEVLTADESALRDQVIGFQGRMDKRLIGLQALHMHRDFDEFHSGRDALEERAKHDIVGMTNLVNLINKEVYSAKWQEAMDIWPQVMVKEDGIVAKLSANQELNGVLEKNGNDIQELCRSIVTLSERSIAQTTKASRILGISIFSGGIILLLFIGMITIQSAHKSLHTVISGVTTSSAEVMAASNHVATSSYHLASSATQQAAALEDAVLSLKEMSSHTEHNADSANQANEVVRQNHESVNEASEKISHLTLSMEEIYRASEETSRIIKTIDEIAFQTNILALNAAVEAARAGEAGAGFAVVADEVRNLAMRSAEAARTTSALIENTASKVHKGSDMVSEFKVTFENVADGNTSVHMIIEEIAKATSGQAEGIKGLTSTMDEMQKVIHENAAAAEQSASAAEELNAQAEEMQLYSDQLVVLVGDHDKNAPPKRTENVQNQNNASKAEDAYVVPGEKHLLVDSE